MSATTRQVHQSRLRVGLVAEQRSTGDRDPWRRIADDTTLGRVVEHYLAPGLHPAWGESRRRTVGSLLRTWVVGDRIRIRRGGHTVAAAALPVGALTPARCEEILGYVHAARAHRTYVDTRRELLTLLRWAARERYLPRDADLWEHVGLARPTAPSTRAGRGTLRPVDPDEIPPTDRIDGLRAVALADGGPAAALVVDLMAYGGLRVGEALALTADRMVRDGTEGCYRPHVVLRAHKSRAELRPPKHERERHAWLPPWLDADVDRVVAGTAPGALLYPAPRGGVWPVDRFRARRFDRWLQTVGWPRTPPHDDRRRRWRWTAHSLRHHAASWMLSELRLAPDDVAAFLGHRDGHQVWVLYSRVLPGIALRASAAARAVGDPRTVVDGSPRPDRRPN